MYAMNERIYGLLSMSIGPLWSLPQFSYLLIIFYRIKVITIILTWILTKLCKNYCFTCCNKINLLQYLRSKRFICYAMSEFVILPIGIILRQSAIMCFCSCENEQFIRRITAIVCITQVSLLWFLHLPVWLIANIQ